MFSCEFYEISKNIFSYRTPLGDHNCMKKEGICNSLHLLFFSRQFTGEFQIIATQDLQFIKANLSPYTGQEQKSNIL